MDTIAAIGRFDLKNGISKMIVGSATTYTFQLVKNGSATLLGSMDDENWTTIAEMTATVDTPDSFVCTHTWRYLKADITGSAILWGNRG
ncbi:hypothetical protein [Acinetobacter venetianus]|uniref:hypothetical protein n=1 Tax=Acinetobacter venetianus TaxID=52133 RepID=UPI003A9537CD